MEFPVEIPIDLSNDELGKDMLTPTEVKNLGVSVDDSVIEAEAENKIEFKPAPAEVEPQAEVVEPAIPVNYRDSAEMVIGSIDSINRLVFPWAYLRTEFSRSERDLLKKNVRKFKMIRGRRDSVIYENMEDQLKDLYDRWVEVVQIIDEIPFTEEEQNMLVTPLEAVLRKYAKAPGPESALILAIGAIYTRRVTPLFANII